MKITATRAAALRKLNAINPVAARIKTPATQVIRSPGKRIFPSVIQPAGSTNFAIDFNKNHTQRGRTRSNQRARTGLAACQSVGRSMHANAITMGYSITLLKTKGATIALKSPPSTPPSDIQM